jgi:hypothetical protein
VSEPKIHSGFGMKTVAQGVAVDYALSGYTVTRLADGTEGSQYAWRWFITYHYLDDDGIESESWAGKKDDAGRSAVNTVHFTKKWPKVGRHLVQCAAKNRATNEFVSDGTGYAKFEQQVATLDAILERQMTEARRQKLPNPHAELVMLWKWASILHDLGKQHADRMSAADKAQNAKRIAELERNAEKLKAFLAQFNENAIYPFHAVYLAKESMEEMPLRVFLTQPRNKTDRVVIVDWTNLDEPKLHGSYEGKFPAWKGRTASEVATEALKAAAKDWESDNRYWPGGIRYSIDQVLGNGARIAAEGTIRTGDTSWTEDLEGVLKKIAMGAAVIALVLTGVGSVYAGAMIVTSMVAGTTASVLSIHHRHSKGQGDFIDDAIDVLDVVANVLGVGYRAGKAAQRALAAGASETVAWKAGRTLRLKISDKVLDAMFIGEVWADGFAGLLLGVKYTKRYFDIMNMTGPPERRAEALLQLFAEAAAQGVLHGVNNKVASNIERGDWNRLLERTDTHDTLVDPPGFRGHTDDGKKQVTVVNKQQRQPPGGARKPNGPPKWPHFDDKVFIQPYKITDREIELRTKNGFYFVAQIDHNGYVTVDIHTRRHGPNGDEQSPQLGTGRENFDRMFEHFAHYGHEVKGWHGIMMRDNYEAIAKAKRKNPEMQDDDALWESITGKKFWMPWARKNRRNIIVEDAKDRNSWFTFSVRFEQPAASQ